MALSQTMCAAWLLTLACFFHVSHGSVQRRSNCSISTGFVINNQSDIDNGPLSACRTIVGDIVLDTASGNLSFSDSGVKEVQGSILLRNNTSLQSLNLSGINTFETGITITNATKLQNLGFDQAILKLPSLNVTNAPQVQSISLNATSMDNLTIDSTAVHQFQLNSLTSLANFIFTNNSFDNATLDFGDLVNLTNIFIDRNADGINKISLTAPKAVSANELFMGGVATADFKVLETIDGALTLRGEGGTHANFPALATVIRSLDVEGTEIFHFDMNNLKNVGSDLSFVVDDCGSLAPLFPSLQSAGSISFGCDENEYVSLKLWARATLTTRCSTDSPVSTFADLEDVDGDVIVNDYSFDCSHIQQLKSNGRIVGQLQCNPYEKKHGLPKGAKAGIGIGATVGGLLLIGLFALAVRHHRRNLRALYTAGSATNGSFTHKMNTIG